MSDARDFIGSYGKHDVNMPREIFITFAHTGNSSTGEWNITVLNQTGAEGLPGDVVDFVLFQTELNPSSCNDCSSIWKIAEVGYPGKIGPIRLPSKVEFCVIDESYGNIRQSGPIPVNFGETISIVQKNPDDAPIVSSVKLTNEEASEGTIDVTNERGNAKPLEMAFYKDGDKLISYKNVRPADTVTLVIKPAIYIAHVERGSFVKGTNFESFIHGEKATMFKLSPVKPDITISIKQLSSGELQFEEALMDPED